VADGDVDSMLIDKQETAHSEKDEESNPRSRSPKSPWRGG
jgi:hypothetical protein